MAQRLLPLTLKGIRVPSEYKFFEVSEVEGVPEIELGSADFLTRPVIILAQDELIQYIVSAKPMRLVINLKNVLHISSEFITAMIRVNDQVLSNEGHMKFSHMHEAVYKSFKLTNLADRVFKIYDTTPQAIDAF